MPRFARELKINLHVGARIDDRPRAFLIVADQIGDCRDAISENTLENQGHKFLVWQRLARPGLYTTGRE